MTVKITLNSNTGADTGPFEITAGGTVVASNITRAQLLAGYDVTVPAGTTQVIVTSTGYCTNAITIPVNAIILDPFDYAIINYQYAPPSGVDYDLDTISAFRYANSSLIGTLSSSITGLMTLGSVIGCGIFAGYEVPAGSNFSNGYLFWGDDDAIQNQDGTYGESIVINFKNLKALNITTSPEVAVDLFAGWHSPTTPGFSYPINLKYETFTGGVITKEVVNGITTNRFVTSGTSVSSPQISSNISIPIGKCSDGPSVKKRIATINFNLDTKQSNLVFY